MLVGFMQEQAYYRWSINVSFLLVGLNTLVGGRDGYPTGDARREEMDHPLRREGGTPPVLRIYNNEQGKQSLYLNE